MDTRFDTPSRFGIARRVMLGQIAAAIGCLATNSPAVSQEAIAPPPFKTGRYQFTIIQPQRMMPAARLQGLDGKTTELSKFRGKVILINFWASWCPPCRKELPILDQLQAMRDSRLQVIAVAIDEQGRRTVEPFIRALKIRLPIYLDPLQDLAYSDRENPRNAPFALYGLPITYVIAQSGLIVGYIPGAAEWISPQGLAFLDRLEAQ